MATVNPHVVKSLGILDVILAILSFILLVAVLLLKGDDAVVSKLMHVESTIKNKETDERTKTIFKWAFFGMIILISFTIHTVQILMAWSFLYKGADKIKKDKINAVKLLSQWRSWSIILTVLLFTGIISFFLVFPHDESFTLWAVGFQSIQILFQIGAIIYIGKIVQELETGLIHPIQSVDLKILYDL